MPRLRITYSGRVQGVGFRATARAVAGGHEVSGWVRNEPDGTVLLEVQGDEPEIASFREALSRRLGGQIVREIDFRVGETVGETGFEIRHA